MSEPGRFATTYGLLLMCRRRWGALIVGAVATVALGWLSVHPQPVFYAQVNAIFLAPVSSAYPNSLTVTSGSLISTASVVERSVDGPSRTHKTSGATVTLYDRGVYEGVAVRLPDTGGQWAENFDSPVLSIEATGRDALDVSAKVTAMEQAIVNELHRRQVDLGVDPVNMIRISLSPGTVAVRQVSGSPVRALGIGTLLGLGGTLALVALSDRIRQRGAIS